MAIRLMLDGVEHHVTIARRRPNLVLVIDGREHEIAELPAPGDGRNAMSVDGRAVAFARAGIGDRQIVRLGGRSCAVARVDPFQAAAGAGGGADVVKAPMPGAVVSVQCAPGDAVARGAVLVTIESMKLQTALVAPRDGTVAQVLRGAGETFEKDEVIVRLDPETEKA